MIQRTLIFLCLLLGCFGSIYSSELKEQADSAYNADNFQQAIELYQKIIDSEGNSPIIQYNLGNSYYRFGKIGNAILAYERALRQNPKFDEARLNLEFVNTKIIDRPGERGSFLSNVYDRAANSQTSNVWAWIGLGLFTLFIISLALYFLSPSIPVRKIGFFGGIILIFLSLGSLILSFRARQIAINPDIAIITSPSVILSTSPRDPKDRNEEAMLLHEGTKLEIIDSVTTKTDSISTKWFEVQVDNSHRAWIKSSELERI
ncbi:MAG: tetratricopeptide repeat protein [Paramuribaculum sp.]|nr:tetratricopeptide repeat protein [Paramuribaculum sp.]